MTKVDTIIDALRLGLRRCPAREMGHFEQALAAARELKALTPVARVVLTEHLGMPIVQWVDLDRSFELDSGALLYALDDEVKHD